MSEYIVDVTGMESGDYAIAREEIVRCRDCKYYVEASRDYGVRTFCDYLDGVSVEPDGFCSWAKRRDDA